MNIPLWVARRYFFSGKEKKFINILSIIAMLGVAIGTAALVIVLSAFNGLEALVRKLDQRFDPQIKISLVEGKFFQVDSALIKKIESIEGVQVVSEVIEDNALLRYKEAQQVVRIKGISDNFQEHKRLDSALIDGSTELRHGDVPLAIIGSGIQNALSIGLGNRYDIMQFWYPKNKKNVAVNPTDAFTKKSIFAGGVFQISSQYDEKYVFVPLSFAQELLRCENKRTALEIKVSDQRYIYKVKEAIKVSLGAKFLVQDSDEQHASFLRIMKIEKLFTFFALLFILVIASFNIFVSLSMLAIEKKRDVSIFYAMGASESFIKEIFMTEGALIAGIGSVVGMGIGLLVCTLQIQYGLVSMGMTSAVVEAYPVLIKWEDVLLTGVCVVIFTIIATYGPAIRASRSFILIK